MMGAFVFLCMIFPSQKNSIFFVFEVQFTDVIIRHQLTITQAWAAIEYEMQQLPVTRKWEPLEVSRKTIYPMH